MPLNLATATREELIEALKNAKKPGKISFKVGEKGGVSVYGLGRFPISLYLSQWERLFEAIPELKEFIAANRSLLAVKE